MSEKILFIGGPKDGKREFLPDGQHQIRCATRILPDSKNTVADFLAVGFQTHTFEIKRFRCEDGTELEIAVHSSVKDVMKQLVKGYHYHRKPRYR